MSRVWGGADGLGLWIRVRWEGMSRVWGGVDGLGLWIRVRVGWMAWVACEEVWVAWVQNLVINITRMQWVQQLGYLEIRQGQWFKNHLIYHLKSSFHIDCLYFFILFFSQVYCLWAHIRFLLSGDHDATNDQKLSKRKDGEDWWWKVTKFTKHC